MHCARAVSSEKGGAVGSAAVLGFARRATRGIGGEAFPGGVRRRHGAIRDGTDAAALVPAAPLQASPRHSRCCSRRRWCEGRCPSKAAGAVRIARDQCRRRQGRCQRDPRRPANHVFHGMPALPFQPGRLGDVLVTRTCSIPSRPRSGGPRRLGRYFVVDAVSVVNAGQVGAVRFDDCGENLRSSPGDT